MTDIVFFMFNGVIIIIIIIALRPVINFERKSLALKKLFGKTFFCVLHSFIELKLILY